MSEGGRPHSSLHSAMKKRIISIILIISLSFSMIKVNTVKSSAFDPTIISDLLRAIGLVTAGAVAGGAAMGLGDCLSEIIGSGYHTWIYETLPKKVTTAANNVFNNHGINITFNNTSYVATPNSSLTGDDLRFATLLANKLNADPTFQTLVEGVSGVIGGLGLPAGYYEQLKTIIGQATAEFTELLAREFAEECGKTLTDMGALPTYAFDFVGPMPGLDFSSLGAVSDTFLLDGYTLVKPFQLNLQNSYYNSSGYLLITDISANYKSFGLYKFNDSVYGYKSPEGTYCGMYVLYNNTIFSYAPYNSNELTSYATIQFSFGLFVSPNGVKLKDLISADEAALLPRGFYYRSTVDGALPILNVSSEFDPDSFTTSITPDPVVIPRNEDEQAVADGIDLGLVSENADLVIDDNGNIVKVDGLDIAKLMELLQTIANNGSISFDSIEQYLQAITALITASNTDSKTLNTVISNLNELTKAQNASIESINANIASIAQALAISDSITADNTFDIDTPSTIIDKFPFSLPFDIQKVFNLLSAEPKAPSYDIPIVMEGVFDYHIKGDLSEYDWIAEIVRWVLYIVFVIGLILITNKLIGRG